MQAERGRRTAALTSTVTIDSACSPLGKPCGIATDQPNLQAGLKLFPQIPRAQRSSRYLREAAKDPHKPVSRTGNTTPLGAEQRIPVPSQGQEDSGQCPGIC